MTKSASPISDTVRHAQDDSLTCDDLKPVLHPESISNATVGFAEASDGRAIVNPDLLGLLSSQAAVRQELARRQTSRGPT